MSDNNRYIITGTVMEVDSETRVISQYFKKRQCKIRVSDIDFTGKICEKKIKIDFNNEDTDFLNFVKVGYTIQVRFLLDGRDYTKDGKTFNFTVPVGFDLVIISKGDDSTEEDKNAVITNDGLQYKQNITIASIDDVIIGNIDKFQIAEDPLFGDIGKKNENKPDNIDKLPF